jgi:hypothetical protein
MDLIVTLGMNYVSFTIMTLGIMRLGKMTLCINGYTTFCIMDLIVALSIMTLSMKIMCRSL